MNKESFLLVLLALTCGVFSELTTKNGIYNVTEDNYEEFIEFIRTRNATAYLKFYTPMCQHCQALKPIYIEAAGMLEKDPDGIYIFAETNSQKYENMGKHFQIQGVPTIYSFSPINDYLPVLYEGPRTVFALVTGIQIAAGLISKELSNYEEFSKRFELRDENMILGIFKDSNSALLKKLQKIKEDFNFIRMYYTYNVKEFKEKLNLGDGDEFILMLHNKRLLEPNDEKFTTYKPDKYSSIRDFIIEEYPYVIDYMSDKNQEIYKLRNRPAAVFFTSFVNRTEEVKKLIKQAKPLAKKFKGKFNMYVEDIHSKAGIKHKYKGNATYIIFDIDPDDSKYRYTDKEFTDDIDVNALIEFTQLVLDGKAPKYIRTAQFNKDDLILPVVTVITSSYDEVVKDPTKHVFLRFYDKMLQRFTDQYQMRIEWYKVGRYFINNTRDDLVIAEIEVKDNDVPKYFLKEMTEKDHYYFLFKKDAKDKPIVYTGEVDAEKLIKFVEGHVGNSNRQTKEDL